jgi:hypothetical protein
MTGNLNATNYQIINVNTGSSGGNAANKSYVDSHSSNYNSSYWTGTNYNLTYDAKNNYNSSYWTGTNYNASYWVGTNYNASYLTSIPDQTQLLFINGTRAMAGNLNMSNYQITKLVTGATGDTAVNKSYVDSGLPYVLSSNSSLILSGNTSYVASNNASLILAGNTSYVSSTNASLVLTNNGTYVQVGNTSYMLVSGSRAMTGNLSMGTHYINGVIDPSQAQDAATKNYVDTHSSNYNASYWTGTNYNATYDAKNNYNSSYWTGTNYNSTYDAKNNYNASYINKDGSVAMTGNFSAGTHYINGVIDPSQAQDAATKKYVDDHASNYNSSYWTGTNYNATYDAKNNYNASYWTGTNYNASYLTTIPDQTQLLFINGTRAMSGNLNMSGSQITKLVTGTSGDTAVNKTYVDAGLPYVLASNSSLILAGNTSYVASSNASLILAGNTSYVSSGNTSLVLTNNASYVLVGGSRAMTGNLSMGSYYINSLVSGKVGSDAVNKTYVDSVATSYNATYDAKNNYNASYWTGTNYNSSYITSTYNTTYDAKVDMSNTTYVLTGGSRAMTANLSLGTKNINSLAEPSVSTDAATKNYVDTHSSNYNASYWTGTNYNSTYDAKNNYNSSYWTGTNYNASYLTSVPDQTQFVFLNGTRSMTGNLNMSGSQITKLVTGATGDTATNKSYVDSVATSYNATYDAKNNYNASYVTISNTSYVLTNNGSYVLTSNTSYVKNPVYGYLTLMAGSAMVTTTNPTTMYQMETTTNKNNAIAINFTDGGSEVGEWVVDFPADWNYSANVIFTPVWTAHAGTGTVKFDVAGKLFPDDAAMDTALASIGTSTDTLLSSGDIHVAPDTTGAAITSVGTGGNTAIIKVTRDSATDTLSGTAELIGLRIKYSRILA